MAVERDNAAEAAQWLHEDRVSETVQAALEALDKRTWVLFHAKDYKLGVLQLLESAGLLRNRAQEEQTEKHRMESLTALRLQRAAVLRLARIAAQILPDTFGAEIERVAKAQTEEELNDGSIKAVTVAGWAHGGSGPDAIALAKVRKLAHDNWRLKTIKRADLLAALGESDER